MRKSKGLLRHNGVLYEKKNKTPFVKIKNNMFYTHVRREDSRDVRRGHPGQTPDAVHQRHYRWSVVRRQVERIDANARITESHERHAHGETKGGYDFVASHKRSAHHAQSRTDGSCGKHRINRTASRDRVWRGTQR